jgi:hypothetical protein
MESSKLITAAGSIPGHEYALPLMMQFINLLAKKRLYSTSSTRKAECVFSDPPVKSCAFVRLLIGIMKDGRFISSWITVHPNPVSPSVANFKLSKL